VIKSGQGTPVRHGQGQQIKIGDLAVSEYTAPVHPTILTKADVVGPELVVHIRNVWLNNDDTLRKEDSRTDVYEVFKRMLELGDVPSTIDELIHESSGPPAMKNQL